MTKSRTIEVSPEVFRAAPNYVRSVLAAQGPGVDVNPAGLVDRFKASVASAERAFGSHPDITQVPAIASWREAFRQAGWSPSKFRSSIEALLRRAARGDLHPMNMPLVDAGTIATLESLVPIGVHILDDVPEGELVLGGARGNERFEAFDGSVESPESGEIVYRCGATVLTRRWVWRQGRVGSIAGKPQLLAVNVDIVNPAIVSLDSAVEIMCEVLALCGVPVVGRVDLTADNPRGVLSGWNS